MGVFWRLFLGLMAVAIAVAFFGAPTITVIRYARFRAHYDMIYNQDGPVDVAFFGTSRAMRAFYLKDLMPMVEQKLGHNAVGYDLSYASRNTDLAYVMLRDLLERRPLKLVVLEYSAEGRPGLHTLFPQLATYGDLVAVPGAGLTKARHSFQLVRDKLSLAMALTNFQRTLPKRKELVAAATTDTTSPAPAEPGTILARGAARATNEMVLPIGSSDNAVQDEYVKRIVALAEDYGTEVVFLYLPAVTQGRLKDTETARFRKYFGKPIYEVPSLEPSDYSDGKHVGWSGLEKINTYLAGVIAGNLAK